MNVEIQRSFVAARMDTYTDMVEVALKAEDVEVKLKDYRKARKTVKSRDRAREELSQVQMRVPQRGFP